MEAGICLWVTEKDVHYGNEKFISVRVDVCNYIYLQYSLTEYVIQISEM